MLKASWIGQEAKPSQPYEALRRADGDMAEGHNMVNSWKLCCAYTGIPISRQIWNFLRYLLMLH